jgi:acyl-homoserine-lactone acylase
MTALFNKVTCCLVMAVALGTASAVAGPAVTGPAVAAPVVAAQSGAGTVTIWRTEYGIPHILATSYEGLGYGEGYAFAQDNPCALAEQAITLAGDRSRWFGPTAAAPSLSLAGSLTNLQSDLYYRSVNATGVVRRMLAMPPPLGPTPQVRAVVAGYVRGYNAYLQVQGVTHFLDPSCRGAAWVRPITVLDIWRRAYQVAVGALGGTGDFLQAIVGATPPGTMAASGTQNTTLRRMPVSGTAPVGVIGSNGLALGHAATTDRSGMVLANPHGPWTGQDRFYQLQLIIPGQLDVSGATFYGLPLILPFGHTRHLAFTATAATDTPYTLQRLQLVPGVPTVYLVDGREHAMTRQVIRVPELGPGGTITSYTQTLYRTVDGPVISAPGPYPWTTTTAYAVRGATDGDLRLLNELLAIDQSESLGQLRGAISTYQGLPSLNVLAADSAGTAAYLDASTVPYLTNAHAAACLATPADRARFAAAGVAVLDGSRSACRLGSDPGAVQSGIYAQAQLPHLNRADYVANSNGSPWLINPEHPLSFPRIVGSTGTEQPPRGRLALDMIEQRLSGTDGLGAPGFTLSTLTKMMLNDRGFFGEQWRNDLEQLCRTHPVLDDSSGHPVNVTAACTVLAGWDLHANLNSQGEVLFREFYDNVTDNGETLPAEVLWKVPFNPARPLTTPSGLNTGLQQVSQALADAVESVGAHHLPFGVPVSAVQQVTTEIGRIPIPGCPEQCYNIISPLTQTLTAAGTYPDVNFGTGFLMATSLTDNGPQTRTILAYGESSNPVSPHHWDQARLLSSKQWITERFTITQIKADPQLTTTALHP